MVTNYRTTLKSTYAKKMPQKRTGTPQFFRKQKTN